MVKPAETLARYWSNANERQENNADVNNHIAEHHLQTKQIDCDSATRILYSTDYYQRLILEIWFTNRINATES